MIIDGEPILQGIKGQANRVIEEGIDHQYALSCDFSYPTGGGEGHRFHTDGMVWRIINGTGQKAIDSMDSPQTFTVNTIIVEV